MDDGFFNGNGTAPNPKGISAYTIANGTVNASLANLDPPRNRQRRMKPAVRVEVVKTLGGRRRGWRTNA